MIEIYTSLLNEQSDLTLEPSGSWKVINPSRTSEVLGQCTYRYSDLDLAIGFARKSLKELKALSLEDRLSILRAAVPKVSALKNDIFDIASLELGRTFEDLNREWTQFERWFGSLLELNLEEPSRHEPRGISVVIGSYVWPLFNSLQFSFLNFLAGNPVILKPSEKSSLTVLKIFKSLRTQSPELEAVQVLIGDREVGRRLVCHEAISTVIFQGSFEVGMRVRQDTLSQPQKEVLLYLGAKNPSIVFEDAREEVFETLLKDAFQGCGQNCQSVSTVWVEASYLTRFSERFHALAKSFKIGKPEAAPLMGPLIDGAILDRYLKFIGISEREGAEIIMRGKSLPLIGKGHFVTPTIARFSALTAGQVRKSISLQTEILSPHLSLLPFSDEANLLNLLQELTHGRSVSIWTEDRERALRLSRALPVGQVVMNQSLLSTDPSATFQVRKRSGNHASHGLGLLSQLMYKKTHLN